MDSRAFLDQNPSLKGEEDMGLVYGNDTWVSLLVTEKIFGFLKLDKQRPQEPYNRKPLRGNINVNTFYKH